MPSGEQNAETDAVPKPSTDDSEPSGETKPEKQGGDQSKPGPGSSRENKDAIPTAGGEKLGQKHWGESDIVPDVPKKRESEGGQVSSAEGQPDGEI